MDKTFFRFDIDDAVASASVEIKLEEKTQNNAKIIKNDANKGLFAIKTSKKGQEKTNSNIEKNLGLAVQKEVNKAPFKVDNYLNFDFKAKSKALQNEVKQTYEEIVDEDINLVIERAQIGVIFY